MKRPNINLNLSTDKLKVIALVGACLAAASNFASSEVKKRETKELVNELVDARIADHYASMKSSVE